MPPIVSSLTSPTGAKGGVLNKCPPLILHDARTGITASSRRFLRCGLLSNRLHSFRCPAVPPWGDSLKTVPAADPASSRTGFIEIVWCRAILAQGGRLLDTSSSLVGPFSCVFTMVRSWETDKVVNDGEVTRVVTMMAAGAQCVRTGTVVEGERRRGQGCGKPLRHSQNSTISSPRARWRSRSRRSLTRSIDFFMFLCRR